MYVNIYFLINVFTIRLHQFSVLNIIFIDVYLLYCSDVIVGSSRDFIFHYDLRGTLEYPVKTLKGTTGSINAVYCINYSNEMHLMSLSLDRIIAVHNFSSGDLSRVVI